MRRQVKALYASGAIGHARMWHDEFRFCVSRKVSSCALAPAPPSLAVFEIAFESMRTKVLALNLSQCK